MQHFTPHLSSSFVALKDVLLNQGIELSHLLGDSVIEKVLDIRTFFIICRLSVVESFNFIADDFLQACNLVDWVDLASAGYDFSDFLLLLFELLLFFGEIGKFQIMSSFNGLFASHVSHSLRTAHDLGLVHIFLILFCLKLPRVPCLLFGWFLRECCQL